MAVNQGGWRFFSFYLFLFISICVYVCDLVLGPSNHPRPRRTTDNHVPHLWRGVFRCPGPIKEAEGPEGCVEWSG